VGGEEDGGYGGPLCPQSTSPVAGIQVGEAFLSRMADGGRQMSDKLPVPIMSDLIGKRLSDFRHLPSAILFEP
jgi:hypothetical protein